MAFYRRLLEIRHAVYDGPQPQPSQITWRNCVFRLQWYLFMADRLRSLTVHPITESVLSYAVQESRQRKNDICFSSAFNGPCFLFRVVLT